ncbi:MAG: hypothetical protein AMXMBFR56_81910 [Polyangiaceae bacterium]
MQFLRAPSARDGTPRRVAGLECALHSAQRSEVVARRMHEERHEAERPNADGDDPSDAPARIDDPKPGQREPGALVAGRYRLERLLGQGGMGQVWAATHTVTRRQVALKFLRPGADLRPELQRRFLREARAASAVDHPNVVRIHDVFALDDGSLLMVMDLLEGETLGSLLERKGKLSLSEASSLLLPVVSAVGRAHDLGIVHRDLKPDNIFVVDADPSKGAVKVLDFGIAKVLEPTVDTGLVTGTGAVLGTPSYMAPEQCFGESDIDHRADLWAIGAILYESLAGMRPVDGDNLGQIVKRLMEGIEPIERRLPDLPRDVTALLSRMLSRERAQRPADLREVAAVLAKHTDVEVPSFAEPSSRAHDTPLHEEPVRIGPFRKSTVSGDESTVAARSTSAHDDTSGQRAVPARSPNRVLVSIGVVGALALLVVGVRLSAGSAASDEAPASPASATASEREAPLALPMPLASTEPAAPKPSDEVPAPGIDGGARPRPGSAPVVKRPETSTPAPSAADPAAPAPPPIPTPPLKPTSTGLVAEPPF